MGKRITIKDVARLSGVNISTVSRCLNGNGRINPETRERVLAVAEHLNYRPNRAARALSSGRSHSIGLIISDIRNPFFTEVARGVEDAAFGAGFDVVLCNSDLRLDKQLHYFRSLVEKGVDGIIASFAAGMDETQEEQLVSFGKPIVLLSRPDSVRRLSTVSADNYQGGFLAGKCLLRLGHRHLALLAGPNHQSNHVARRRGFEKALQGAEPATCLVVLHSDQNFAGGYHNTWKVLEAHPETTAVFASNDAMAFGVLRALTEAGRRVPDDVSVIGFDNVEYSSMMQTPLTTIDQPKLELGKVAVEILLDLDRRGPDAEPVHRLFGVQLIERQSTAPVRHRQEHFHSAADSAAPGRRSRASAGVLPEANSTG